MANREFNNTKINVEFQETANRQQISSGDEIKTLFGKIKKWLSDLKTVAFTGKFNDLSDAPYLPLGRDYKQSVYVVNPRNTVRYVRIASVYPNNTSTTNVGIGLKMQFSDYEPTSKATIHFGFACWQNGVWVDWCGFKTTSEWNANTSVANSNAGASKLKDKLVLVQDPLDTYGVEIWLKLEQNDAIYVELDYYTEYMTTGTYPNWEADAHANIYAGSYQCMNFVHPDNIKYLDHVPTSTDYMDGQTWEDYPNVLMGSWS